MIDPNSTSVPNVANPDVVQVGRSVLDLSKFTDEQIVQAVAKERPDFILSLGRFIDAGLSDEQIVRLVCDAGGSAQVMRYARRCLTPMRRWTNQNIGT